ncbi:MAG: ComF family protein [Clostridia bacterium]|nr:ComF family protein [Clostridia bacterium]
MSKFKNAYNLIKRSLFNTGWTCNACGREIFSGYFCDECLKNIVKIGENKCLHCGRQAPYKTEYCDSCIEKNIGFDVARSVYEYTHPLSIVIQNFKYNNARYHAEFFAREMFEVYKAEKLSSDIVTFVPMHQNREQKRGYNQARLLAEELSKLSGVKLEECATKIKETENQANLSMSERVKNLKGTFKVDGKLVKGKSVLLIDDVLTTGSTVDVLSTAFKKAGAVKVSVLTLASVSKIVKQH